MAAHEKRDLLRTGAGLVLLPPLIATLALAAILLALLGVRAAHVHSLYVLFARVAMWLGGTRVEVRGRERLQPATRYIVVSNHESAWDPLCLLASLRELVLRFVVKRSIMRIPVFGHALGVTGNVMVLRTDTPSDISRIRHGMEGRDPMVSMLFFAEGTRSRDGALHRFKKGAFATALLCGLPILPIGIAGTFRIWPKGRFGVRAGRVAVEIGRPIPVAGRSEEDRDALRDETFAAVRDLRRIARRRLRDEGSEPGGID